jgi:hypothetical protein
MSKILLILLCGKALFSSFEYSPVGASKLFPVTEAAVEYTVPGRADRACYAVLSATPSLGFSFEQPYSLKDLMAGMTVFTMPAGNLGFMISWAHFGMEGYRENTVRSGMGYTFGKIFTTGIDAAWCNLGIDIDSITVEKNYFDLQWSAVLSLFSLLDLSFTLENIRAMIYDERDSLLQPRWSSGIRFVPVRGFSLIWNISKSSGTLLNTISATAHILPAFSLSMGYVRETTACSAAAVLLYGHVSSSYCLKFHPYLGATHSFSVTLMYDHIALPSLQFDSMKSTSSRRKKIREKININVCTLEELTGIPVVNEDYAERIYKYRQLIGPVSEKSLYQIGMNSADIKELHEYAHGFAREEKRDNAGDNHGKKGKRQEQKGLYHEERRRMFVLLVDAGIRPLASLKITEQAKEGGLVAVDRYLREAGELDDGDKEKVRKICASFR